MNSILILAAAMIAGQSVETTEPFPAVSVTGIDNVCEGAAHWTGPDDLSFTYSLHQDGNELVIDLNVTDDDVGEGDVVEVYLMDAALMEAVLEVRQRIQGLATEVSKMPKNQSHDMPFDCCAAQLSERTLPNFDLRDFRSEWHFNALSASVDSGSVTSEGYGAELRFDPTRTLNIKNGTVGALAYSIVVRDVDGADEEGQYTLMHSTPSSVLGAPAMSVWPLPAMIECIVPEPLLWQCALDETGWFRACPTGYEFMVLKEDLWNCCHDFFRSPLPARYESVPIEPLCRGNGIGISVYQETLILQQGENIQLVDVGDLVHAIWEWEYDVLHTTGSADKLYMLLQAAGWSRYGGGFCGSGREVDLLLLSVDIPTFTAVLTGERLQACMDNIHCDELVHYSEAFTKPLELKGGMLDVTARYNEYSVGKKRFHRHIRFDTAHPDLGLQVEEVPLPTNTH